MSIIEYYNKILNQFNEEENQIWTEHKPTFIKNKEFYTLFEIIIMVEGESFGKYSDELLYLIEEQSERNEIINKLVQEGKGNYMHRMIDRLNNWCPKLSYPMYPMIYPITLKPINYPPS
jgi:hypothetical protein